MPAVFRLGCSLTGNRCSTILFIYFLKLHFTLEWAHIEFIAKKQIDNRLIKKFNTLAGVIDVATPELLAADLVNSPQHAAGAKKKKTQSSKMNP